MILLVVGLLGAVTVLAVGVSGLPAFGGHHHPYRDLAVAASLRHATANVVSAVNFDQRALDTFGEETILVASVAGVAALLRPVRRERRRRRPDVPVMDSTRLLTAVFFPVTLLIGIDVVAHGAITPGGGFQGGVVLATGIHLLYVGGRYRLLERMRPLPLFEITEAAGLVIFIAIGAAGLAVAGHVFTNILPQGQLGRLISSGTVVLLSGAVGMAVVSSVVILLAGFLDQALALEEVPDTDQDSDGAEEAAR
jgi:multicomponent Na+:H+ antiporter subunit B